MNIAIEHHVLHVDYIEIAVNGAGYQVLQGMGNLIECTDRLLVKGHAREKDSGHAINRQIALYLSNHGFQTLLTKRTPSFSAWGDREGDVYAWK
jgi:hypothetical protein